jgi:NAD(P)-dependent dehydrogenase (short-subunit alcohol dehydrogenase family)
VVLVTGAAHGIGQAIALAFAAEGDAVVVNEREEAATRETVEAIRAAGGRAIGIGADVASGGAVDAMFERARAELGDVSVVVNNAAWYEFINPSHQSVESFERTFATDVTQVFHTMKAAVPSMKRAGGGVIISIASVNAYVTIPQNAAYSAAKAAVVALTRALALELGPVGIRVVSISPGFTATPAVQAYIDSLSEERKQAELGAYYERIPLRRLVKPEEIADTAVFLASPRASAITGTDILVDAGMNCLNKVFSYNP